MLLVAMKCGKFVINWIMYSLILKLALCCCVVTYLCLCLSFPPPFSCAPHILSPSPTLTLSSKIRKLEVKHVVSSWPQI